MGNSQDSRRCESRLASALQQICNVMEIMHPPRAAPAERLSHWLLLLDRVDSLSQRFAYRKLSKAATTLCWQHREQLLMALPHHWVARMDWGFTRNLNAAIHDRSWHLWLDVAQSQAANRDLAQMVQTFDDATQTRLGWFLASNKQAIQLLLRAFDHSPLDVDYQFWKQLLQPHAVAHNALLEWMDSRHIGFFNPLFSCWLPFCLVDVVWGYIACAN
jgi:hypothetical protein